MVPRVTYRYGDGRFIDVRKAISCQRKRCGVKMNNIVLQLEVFRDPKSNSLCASKI